MVILGISLGTTTAGIAIIEERQLIDWQTHSFRAVWSEHKADAIVKRLGFYIHKYNIAVVVIKLPPPSHQPDTIMHLLQKMLALCAYQGCMAKTVTKGDLKKAIPTARNHADVMRFVLEHYPVITPHYVSAVSRKNQYHKKLFEAIVSAHQWDTDHG